MPSDDYAEHIIARHARLFLPGCGGVMIELEMHFHNETEKAIKVSENGDERKAIWLPKSQIEYQLDTTKTTVTVSVPEWLATKHGLI